MSKNREFSNTSANRYSLALFELASESSILVQIEKNSFAVLKLISTNQEFNNLIKDPTISREILTNVINKISDNNKLEILFKNFLNFLIDKRGELKAEIKSSKKLTQDEIEKITNELSNNFKSKIRLNYNHDESLIGGLVVQVGSTMIDTSIKSKLQQIENRMIEA